ncbi:hypothetical protein CRYUN_Cryun01aG0094100 [Craigia yunnanensis]
MRPPLLPSKFWFFMIISLILILTPRSVFSIDGNMSSCSALFHCGNIQNIGYPFWGLDRPESCGHPSFRLSCNEDIPDITIMSATYRVLNLNSSTQVLEVARLDYTDNICPTYLINSTLISGLFEYDTATQDKRLYCGCQLITVLENTPSIQGISTQFECTINGTNIIGYYVTSNIGSLATFISNSLGLAITVSLFQS